MIYLYFLACLVVAIMAYYNPYYKSEGTKVLHGFLDILLMSIVFLIILLLYEAIKYFIS